MASGLGPTAHARPGSTPSPTAGSILHLCCTTAQDNSGDRSTTGSICSQTAPTGSNWRIFRGQLRTNQAAKEVGKGVTSLESAGGSPSEMALPGAVRRQLDSLTRETVPQKGKPTEAGEVDIVSSLPLQISLYFNTFYFPFWWISDVIALQLKYILLPDHYKFILVTLLILMSVIEVIRLFLGYRGNLQEKVPELAGFWLLSILLQLPLLLFLIINPGVEPLPLEWATHGILVLFLLFQLPLSSFTLRRTTGRLAGRFHLLGTSVEQA
ncbi:transmembrane protein 17A-like isoform X1 [Hyperolius riggenbachi]|uniref:transmembrane protein 17A-like isoform X1 n=2 Tax=Hyperolius riggenbachi TaxID=752182 RepID=UPI0035A2F771